jgi:hypothetical protein
MQNSMKIKSKILGEDARNTKPKFIKKNAMEMYRKRLKIKTSK